jgi:signal transduction histidine kinase
MIGRTVDGLTLKAAVLVGFGLTLGLWLFVGYEVTGRMTAVEQQAAQVNVRYMLAQELLATVRSQMLLASVYVRDALLDPEPTASRDYIRRLEATYESIDAALEKYVPILDSVEERERVDRLRSEFNDFRAETLQVLKTDSTRWPREARNLLRRVMPKREAAIRVSDEVQALNRVAFVQQQAVMADMHAVIQDQVWTRLGVALGLSFGIALLASSYAGRLERRLRKQRALEEEHAAELQRLSARLVDAQEEERRRIARELHDEVGQLLSAIKVELALAQRRIQGLSGSPAILDDAGALADTALHTVRDLSHLLHPPVLDDLGLAAALTSYTADFGRRHGIAVDFSCKGMDDRLPPEVEAAAYRIVQEALTNVARHAKADSCSVHAERAAARLVLTIADDGAGFDVAAVERQNPRGLGLVGIRERVVQLRGTVSIETALLAGTRIVVRLPTPQRVQEEEPATSASSAPLPARVTAPEALHG